MGAMATDFSELGVKELRTEASRMQGELSRLRSQKRDLEKEGERTLWNIVRGVSVETAEAGSAFVTGRYIVRKNIGKTPIPWTTVPGAIGFVLKATGLANRFGLVDVPASFMTQMVKTEIGVAGFARRLKKAGINLPA